MKTAMDIPDKEGQKRLFMHKHTLQKQKTLWTQFLRIR